MKLESDDQQLISAAPPRAAFGRLRESPGRKSMTSVTSYSDWNAAIADFFTSGIRDGSPVYLTVDDDSLAYVGRQYLGLPAENACKDFIAAVKERCTEATGTTCRVRVDAQPENPYSLAKDLHAEYRNGTKRRNRHAVPQGDSQPDRSSSFSS
jgi:hypothetical protein